MQFILRGSMRILISRLPHKSPQFNLAPCGDWTNKFFKYHIQQKLVVGICCSPSAKISSSKRELTTLIFTKLVLDYHSYRNKSFKTIKNQFCSPKGALTRYRKPTNYVLNKHIISDTRLLNNFECVDTIKRSPLTLYRSAWPTTCSLILSQEKFSRTWQWHTFC